MKTKDQLGNTIEFNFPPKRVVSLVPSQSELLWDLGLEKELVGITKFCIHPTKMFRSVTRVGGTKKVNLKKIEELKPDLIIGNKEENEKADIEKLRQKYPVWMSDIYTIDDAVKMIADVGKITNREKEASQLLQQIKKRTATLFPVKAKTLKVAYFIWKNPFMVAGKNNYINSLLSSFNFENVFASKKFSEADFSNKNIRYPEISAEQLKNAQPELILLSSEPYPFKEKHVKEFSEICQGAKVVIVDGEMFSWYGSRILKGLNYVNDLRKSLTTIET